METLTYILCMIMFVLGQLLLIMWVKIPALRRRFKKANASFLFHEYWSMDWHLIVGTTIVAVIALIGSDEIFHYNEKIMEYVKFFFAGIGYFAQSVVLAKLSNYEKVFEDIVDIKTDELEKLKGE